MSDNSSPQTVPHATDFWASAGYDRDTNRGRNAYAAQPNSRDAGYQLDKDKRRKQDESGQQDTTTDLQEDLREDQMI